MSNCAVCYKNLVRGEKLMIGTHSELLVSILKLKNNILFINSLFNLINTMSRR